MPRNIIDKIWDTHVVKQNQGHPAVFGIDLQLIHEVTSPQGFQKLRDLDLKVKFPYKHVATLDHSIPTRQDRENIHDLIAKKQVETLRQNVKDFGIQMFDYNSGHQGIVHVIGPELGLTQPGMTIVCGDSHTSTHGAFGALAFGVGSTEVGLVMATGCILQKKPKTFKIEFKGSFPAGVYSKDAILYLISKIGVGGSNGYVMEFCGQAVEEMSMQARMSMCNMSIEGGARAGLVQPDLKTVEWVLGLEEGELSENEKFKVQSSKSAQDSSEYKFDPNFCLEFENYKMVPVSLDYAEDIFENFTDEITNFMTPKSPEKIQDTIDFIEEAVKENQENTDLYLAIIDKHTDSFVGCSGLHKTDTKTPEFGIWIKKEYHGKKIGRKAITALKNWAEQNFDYDYFLYPVDKNNIPSRKIPESLGGIMTREYQETNQSGKVLNLIEFRIPNSLKENKNLLENITELTPEQKLELKRLYEKAYARSSLRKYSPEFKDWEKAIIYWLSFRSDQGSKYDKEIVIDASKLKPMITWGTNPAQGMFIDEAIPKMEVLNENEQFEQQKALKYTKLNPGQKLLGQEIDWVFLGSCTNSRMEDLRIAAEIFYPDYKLIFEHFENQANWQKKFNPNKVKKIADNITMYIVPGSEAVKAQAEAEGLDKIFKAAGADWRMPGCSMCLGMNDDKVPTGKRCLSTSNRNFMHRQGPGSITHLCSPATATASAIAGKIVDASKLHIGEVRLS